MREMSLVLDDIALLQKNHNTQHLKTKLNRSEATITVMTVPISGTLQRFVLYPA